MRSKEVMQRRWTIGLWIATGLMAAIVLLFDLGGYRTFGSHEVFTAVPAREMQETGDYIVPRFGGIPRLQKPPLYYWLVCASSTVTGDVNEFSARLPAALSALGLAILIGVWARRWYGDLTGAASALVVITTAWVILFARKAEVDMVLCLLTTATLFLVAHQPHSESRGRSFLRWTVIYTLIGLAWLAKFHYGPAMVIAPTVIYLLMERRRRLFWNLFNPLGLLIVAACVIIWPWMLLQHIPDALELWKSETVGRAVGEKGTQPIWFYVPHLFWMSLPWTLWTIAALPSSFRCAWTPRLRSTDQSPTPDDRQRSTNERFLWIWFLTQFLIVMLSASKHKHYLIAALPTFALWAGPCLAALISRASRGERVLSARWAAILSVLSLAGAACAALATVKWVPELSKTAQLLAILYGVGCTAMFALISWNRPSWGGVVGLAVFAGCFVIGIEGIMPTQDHRQATAAFCRDVRSELHPDEPVHVYRMGMNPVVFYLDSPVTRLESDQAMAEELKRRRELLIVAYETDVGSLSANGRSQVIRRMSLSETDPAPQHPPLVLLRLEAETTPRIAGEPLGKIH